MPTALTILSSALVIMEGMELLSCIWELPLGPVCHHGGICSANSEPTAMVIPWRPLGMSTATGTMTWSSALQALSTLICLVARHPQWTGSGGLIPYPMILALPWQELAMSTAMALPILSSGPHA